MSNPQNFHIPKLMKRTNFIVPMASIFVIGAILSLLMASCHSDKSIDTSFKDFPKSFQLEGRAVSLSDSTIRCLGSASVSDDYYVFFTYDAPYLFTTTDKEFKNIREFGKKGEGPGEINGSFATCYPEAHNSFGIYNSSAKKMYSVDIDSSLNLSETISFPENFNNYDPIRVQELDNDNYVGIRGDFRYGLVCYNPENGEVTEWPLGGDFDIDNPDPDEVSIRVINYNKDKGIIAEIYGSYPTIILHNEDGSILKRITYTGYEKHKKDNDRANNCFGNLVLGGKYIWVLYGDKNEMENNIVFCLDYEGNPIAELVIEPTGTIAIDEKENRILAIDPNKEEKNLMVYDLPDFFK